ncbi:MULTISPECIES: DUF192 domain-containing protein [unclassified Thioalkalivibrio]|uniref:DUF192 domain-containing protein n=1 Tax=unclassified Thioalkalivibrio TaxID=2621013 RepID=UPI000372F07E|nr:MULTISPECIES: DUF192 domain-containing protein [unclassified Thioalkalivibrio]
MHSIPRIAPALVAGAALLGVLLLWGSPQAGPGLPVTELKVGERTLSVEIAADEPARRQGLMHREELADDQGMLFVWDHPARYAMWMRNTYIPLDVAFIDADYRITNIETMEPQTTTLHEAKRDVLYALEVNAGWFEENDVSAGDRIDDLPRALGKK